jgi:hypothetical protein
MAKYGYTIEYIEAMDIMNFLKFACIMKEEKWNEEIGLAQLIQIGNHGTEEAWEEFLMARGNTPPKYQDLLIEHTSEERLSKIDQLKKNMDIKKLGTGQK